MLLSEPNGDGQAKGFPETGEIQIPIVDRICQNHSKSPSPHAPTRNRDVWASGHPAPDPTPDDAGDDAPPTTRLLFEPNSARGRPSRIAQSGQACSSDVRSTGDSLPLLQTCGLSSLPRAKPGETLWAGSTTRQPRRHEVAGRTGPPRIGISAWARSSQPKYYRRLGIVSMICPGQIIDTGIESRYIQGG